MGQRLGIASALLGDPATLILDEPVNGLDPEGILWIRNLLKSLAAEGRTVFVSSHLMSEMALTAEHLIVVGRGRLIADTSVEEFTRQRVGEHAYGCAPPTRSACAASCSRPGRDRDQRRGRGAGGERARPASRSAGPPPSIEVVLYELTTQQASLEEAFMELTHDAVEYQAAVPAAGREHVAEGTAA